MPDNSYGFDPSVFDDALEREKINAAAEGIRLDTAGRRALSPGLITALIILLPKTTLLLVQTTALVQTVTLMCLLVLKIMLIRIRLLVE